MNYTMITFIGVVIAFYYDTFKWLVESWMYNPYYSHGFIVLIISTYIILNMTKDLSGINREESKKGLIVFIGSIILQGIANIYTIRFLSGLSLIMAIFGTLLYIYGWKFAKKVSFPIMFLLLAIPLPFIDIVAPLSQTTSAVMSSSLINDIGIRVQRDGLVLSSAVGSFEVALECSGLKLIMSLLTLSVIYSFILEGSLLMKLVIILSSIPFAIISNVLRIASIIIVANTYGKDVTMNYFHDLSSFLLFGIASVGIFLVGRLFGKLKFKEQI